MSVARFYVALCLLASPAAAFSPGAQARLAPLLTGQVANMVIHDAPRDAVDAPLIAPDGAEATVQDLPAGMRFVNIWATWCPPCVKEMPSIDRMARALASDAVAVVPVSTDRGDSKKPQEFLDGLETDLKTWRDPRLRFAQAAGVLGQPTTLILDAQGREVARLQGDAEWDAPEALALMRAMAREIIAE